MKTIWSIVVVLTLLACNNSEQKKELVPQVQQIEIVKAPVLNLKEANILAELPLHCINTEYPNRLSQTLGGDEDLKSPTALHPAFYGCFDWHSSVHGHWSLVKLLKSFPNIDNAEAIKQRLLLNISKENLWEESNQIRC